MSADSGFWCFLRRSWGTVALALVIPAFLAASVPLSRTAAWIPRVVLLITLVLIVVQLAREAREQFRAKRDPSRPATRASSAGAAASAAPDITVAKGDAEPRFTMPMRATSPVMAVLWILGLMLSVLLLGIPLGGALFCFAYLHWHARETYMMSGAFAVGLGASLQLAFGALLKAQLYSGWLWHLVQ